jgi:anti-sigma factor RsiW
MTCREAIEFLMSYLDGEISPDVRVEFERHLAECKSCVAYLNSYRQTIELCKSGSGVKEDLKTEELPEELVRAIQTALKNA